jgi:hypothetical protein
LSVGLCRLSGGIGLSSLGAFVSVGAAVVLVVDGVVGCDDWLPPHAANSAEIPINEMSFFIFKSSSEIAS